MRAVALTELAIKNLKPRPDERYEVFDSKLPGFAVRVFPTGLKSFVVLYRVGGRQRRLTIGRYGVITLADARRLALDALHKVAHGGDPQSQKQDAKQCTTFADAVDQFVRVYCGQHNRPSTAHETERLLRHRFLPRWGRRNIRDIRKSEIVSLLDQIIAEGKPSAANHALAVIRKLFSWCEARDLIDRSPCHGIRAPASIPSRDRVLSDDELAQIWKGSAEYGYPYGSLVRLLILTAQRRGEVVGMRWSEIDFDKRIWSIPAERTKSNRAHSVPLSKLAIDILLSLPRWKTDLVFPGQGEEGRTLSGFSKFKRRLDAVALVEGWTLHDLRRSAATALARSGTPPHVVEKILNHSEALGGVAGIYNRFAYTEEMRSALEFYAEHLRALMNQSSLTET